MQRFGQVECAKHGIAAHHLSRRMGEAESWRCLQHDLQIEFAGAETTHLLVYMACQKGSLAWAQGSTRCQSQRRKGH